MQLKWKVDFSVEALPATAIVIVEEGEPRVGDEVTCVETGARYRVSRLTLLSGVGREQPERGVVLSPVYAKPNEGHLKDGMRLVGNRDTVRMQVARRVSLSR